MKSLVQREESNLRQYEALFIVTPSFDESEMTEASEIVKELIETNGGKVLFIDLWGKKRLAYPVQGHGDGYYVLMVFNGDSELLSRINNHFRITEPIIRHLVVTFEGDLDSIIVKQQEVASRITRSDTQVTRPDTQVTRPDTQVTRPDTQDSRKEPKPLPDVISEDENDEESSEE
ncbi:TPA: 30S ribosomal protein S6 [Candidatus Poribacteria bacterium]|nr:30S ribosomal protein S6 [Candidatus Poribacteria bacterium]